MTKDQLVSEIYRALPYSDQITYLDSASEEKAVRFIWRGTKFRVTTDFFVEEVGDGILKGTDLAMLFERLLQKVNLIRHLQDEEEVKNYE